MILAAQYSDNTEILQTETTFDRIENRLCSLGLCQIEMTIQMNKLVTMPYIKGKVSKTVQQ